jgi:hypothetical protein
VTIAGHNPSSNTLFSPFLSGRPVSHLGI